jgi:hypothetical protein
VIWAQSVTPLALVSAPARDARFTGWRAGAGRHSACDEPVRTLLTFAAVGGVVALQPG